MQIGAQGYSFKHDLIAYDYTWCARIAQRPQRGMQRIAHPRAAARAYTKVSTYLCTMVDDVDSSHMQQLQRPWRAT